MEAEIRNIMVKTSRQKHQVLHAVANARKNNNAIVSLPLDENMDSTPVMSHQLPQFLHNHFRGIMGSTAPLARPFDLSGKIGDCFALELQSLDDPIMEDEIRKAVQDMPRGKASRPDGFPIEFYHTFWSIVKKDIVHLVQAFFNNNASSLKQINRATVTLILKKKGPQRILDYRPINVINTIAKLIPKILATKLQPHLQTLILPNQTAFIKGRSIMESFLTARELVSYCSKNKLPTVLYKVDFEKAFDIVNWCFLVNVLIERGFPPKWLATLLKILCSSSSAIKVNGDLTRYFTHKRGLRQGDPLSPLIFILVADSLSRFIKKLETLMPQHSGLLLDVIQYADDTLIVAEAHPTTPRIICMALQNYTELSGLKLNSEKLTFVPIEVPGDCATAIGQILSATQSHFPITYMGLPLAVKKIQKINYQKLISSMQARLESWTSNTLSYGGRIVLLKSVLYALPLHYMQVLKIPARIIKTLTE